MQRAREQLGGVVDDECAPGAAAAHEQLACGLVEHQGGRHGRARAFARFDPVGDRAALRVGRGQAEIGQLVVEQKAAWASGVGGDHSARAKGGFDGGGHGHCAALRIDYADVAGAVLCLCGHGGEAGGLAAGLARRGRFHGLGTDQPAAISQVSGGHQAAPVTSWGAHKIRVGHILGSIGKSQARGFGVTVQPVGGGQAACQLGALCCGVAQHAQNLADGDLARRRRRKAADAVGPRCGRVVKTQGLAHSGLVAGQVLQAEGARARRLCGARHHGSRHRPLEQGAAAPLGDTAQHMGVFGVAQHMAHGPGSAIGLVEKAQGQRVFFEQCVGVQQGVQTGADPKALLGQRDGGCQQLRPRQAAVLAVGHLQHPHHTWHAHRMAALHGIGKRQGLALVHEHVCAGAGGGGFAPVVRGDFLAIKVQQKRAATNATRLRLHQTQHHLHGNGRIQRRAACAQHLVPRIGGQRVGRSHGLAREGPAGFGGIAAGRLGLRGVIGRPVAQGVGGRLCGAGAQKRQDHQAPWPCDVHVFLLR